MKLSYEKLLLGLGGLALLLGIGFYGINFSKIFSERAEIGRPGSNQYEPIPVPTFDKSTATWPNALEQAPGELYDVFTPPAIWIDENGTFIFKSVNPLPEVPFDLYLAELENEPYRIQLEGYVEEDFDNPRKSVLLLFDEEQQTRIRARVGESIAGHEFSVYNFTIDRVRYEDSIVKLAVATVLDFRDGRRRFLTHGKRKYKETTTVVLRSKKDPEWKIRITQKPPYAFSTATAKYVLEKINLEESFVLVKKLGDSNQEPETKQLFLKSNNESEKTSNNSLELKTDNGNQFFDFDF